jgi:flagellar motor switch/type III secretory pathway protein FliN
MKVADEGEANTVEVRPIPLRIDLGSLELSVEEIAALRPGAQLEIDGSFPAECFLRIGATALARGVLEVGGDGFMLRVEEVF